MAILDGVDAWHVIPPGYLADKRGSLPESIDSEFSLAEGEGIVILPVDSRFFFFSWRITGDVLLGIFMVSGLSDLSCPLALQCFKESFTSWLLAERTHPRCGDIQDEHEDDDWEPFFTQ